MIQRVQSLYLLGTVLLHILLFFSPLATAVGTNLADLQSYFFDITGLYKGAPPTELQSFHPWYSSALLILNVIIILIAFGDIFLFRNRMLQLRLARIAAFAEVVFIVFIFFAINLFKEENGLDIQYKWGIGLPVVALILLILAGRNILKDEKLVRSADRLR